jgi:predicted transcriptional regulator
MATRYTKGAQVGDQGIAHIRYVVANTGLIYRAFENADLGVDAAIEFLNDAREPSGDLVLVQAKAGSSFVSDDKYYIRADLNHFETWSKYSIPVVGIVYNPKKADARWVSISEHLRKHPEQIVNGPYSIEAPREQVFTVETIQTFIDKFRTLRTVETIVATPPNLSIRAWEPDDAIATRALLAPIASDYPGFYDWLERQWAKPEVSKKVVQVGGTIAAYSMWTRKDDRNVKLQTFIVGSLFQGTAVGQHLLYHELRHWAEQTNISRVFVTISSNKADLTHYFYKFGFAVEGIAANRYDRNPHGAELVLAKHFVRGTVTTPQELESLKNTLCERVWGIGDGTALCSDIFGIQEENLSAPLRIGKTVADLNLSKHTVDSRIVLKDEKGNIVRRYGDYTLMREFYPLKLHLLNKKYIVVPIRPEYSRELFALDEADSAVTALKLRIDNVYYCTPRHTDLKRGDLVLFYETMSGGGLAAAFGTAIVRQCIIDDPKLLWRQYHSRGVFKLSDIKEHTRDDKAMAIHFDLYEPFPAPVPLDRIRVILNNGIIFQSLTSLTRDNFQKINAEGRESR